MVVEWDGRYLRADHRGRWVRLGLGGRVWRRLPDGRVLGRHAGAWEEVAADEQAWLHVLAGRLARGALGAIDGDARIVGEPADLATGLGRVLRWGGARHRREALRAGAAWPEPVRILPPHRYRDLVVQPASGCPNRRCTFCAFYRGRAFRILDRDAFEAHLRGVRRVLGRGLRERTGIFLGSASALTLPTDVVLDRMARARSLLPRPRRGFAAFLDPERAPRRSAGAWARLFAAGLRDVTIGLETALAPLRASLGKSRDLGRLGAQMGALREAGVAVSLSVLVGLGPPETERAHREATIRWLGGLALGAHDRVYLSPLWRAGAAPDAEALPRWREDLRPVTAARIDAYRIERFAGAA